MIHATIAEGVDQKKTGNRMRCDARGKVWNGDEGKKQGQNASRGDDMR